MGLCLCPLHYCHSFSLRALKHVFILAILPSIFTSLCMFYRELSNAADTATRLYQENTPESRRLATKFWDTMTKAQEKLIKSIPSQNFEKFISVAHKDNGEATSTSYASNLFPFGLQLHLSFILISSFLTLSYVAERPSFFHIPLPRYDNRKTPKGGNHPCRCLLQSQVASVAEFSRQGQNQKSIPLFSSSP